MSEALGHVVVVLYKEGKPVIPAWSGLQDNAGTCAKLITLNVDPKVIANGVRYTVELVGASGATAADIEILRALQEGRRMELPDNFETLATWYGDLADRLEGQVGESDADR